MEILTKATFAMALSLFIIFSAGSASAENVLLNFFGGQSGLIIEEDIEDFSKYEVANKDGESVGGFFSFVRNLFGFWQPDDDEVAADALSDTVDLIIEEEDEYTGPAPTFTCLPNTVVADEPALMLWQCLDGSEEAYIWDDTDDVEITVENTGSTKVYSTESRTYYLDCANGASAQCSVNVTEPTITIAAGESAVPMWETVNVSWSTADVQTCVLDSDDDSSKYVSWRRSGTDGDVYSHPITKETKFTLTCITETGLEKEESITVVVE